jgi:alpha-glucoside transport system substrate-binding protein
MEAFTEETGIDVVYEGSATFETLIRTRAEGGNPPDIALFPQPGLMADLARQDQLQDLSGMVDVDAYGEAAVPGLLDLGTVDDTVVGLQYRLNIKSLVWYPKPEFEEAGYEIPETHDELLALSDQIVEDGGTPWCIGIESADATGWVVTDWFEDFLLRTAGPEFYDGWVEGTNEFSSEEVTRVGELVGDIWFNDDYVLGGRQSIVTTPFGDAPDPMFNEEPDCWLHRQASFITGFFPDDVQENLEEEAGFFYLPPIDEDQGSPILIAGDLASAFNDDESTAALMQYLATPEAGNEWAQQGGFLSAFADFDTSLYPDEITRQQGEIVANADVARFDGSDLMPGQVGAGSFWTEMTSWVNGGVELEDALMAIDEDFPEPGETTELESEG